MLSMLWLTMVSMPTSVILSNSFPALEEAAAAAGVPRISFCFDLLSLNWEVGCRAKLFAAVSGLCRRQKKIYCGTPKRFFVG